MMTYKEKIVAHYKGREHLATWFIKALRELLEQYKKKDWLNACPLCCVGAPCEDCPCWVLLNKTCTRMEEIRDLGLMPARKAQLRYWMKSYEAGVKELIKGGEV